MLHEIGPFTYRLFLNKTAIKFNDNGTVTYREVKTWIFQPDRSYADENLLITTLNGPLAITLTLIQASGDCHGVVLLFALISLLLAMCVRKCD